jgi:hypothetical protein
MKNKITIQEFVKKQEEIKATGLIKVRYIGLRMREHLWAKPLGNNTAELHNIPFQYGISLHDIVEYDAGNTITKVIKRVTRRGDLNYTFISDKSYGVLVKHFEDNKVSVEGAGVEEGIGFASLAVPFDMTEKRIHEIANSCPTEIIALKISNERTKIQGRRRG